MTSNQLVTIIRPARHGSKKDWVRSTVQFPPDVDGRLRLYAEQKPAFIGDLITEAVTEYLDRRAA